MAAIEYRVFFDNAPATQEQLDKIEEITVEQEVDMMWEAHVQIPICVDGNGKWEGEDEAWMRDYTRVRVEARIGDNEFSPLIDGPVVRHDATRSNVPGKSVVTLIVRDDSVFLTKTEETLRYEEMPDSQIARQIFGEIPELAAAPPDIPEETQASSTGLQPVTMQRGTRMRVLRTLAARQRDFHAYVLPGTLPGMSIGAFRRFPTESDGLPMMVLLGDGKNLKEFTVRNNSERASDVEAASLSIGDKSISTATASYSQRQFMTDEPAAGADNAARRKLRSGAGDTADLQSAVDGEVNSSGYTADATGSVIPHCYHGVLSPYRVVAVSLSDSQHSANYLITKVTHKLTRSTYTQDFSAKGDSISSAVGGGSDGSQPSADFSVSFNVQGSIF